MGSLSTAKTAQTTCFIHAVVLEICMHQSGCFWGYLGPTRYLLRASVIAYSMVWYGMVWHSSMVRYGMVWYGIIWYIMIRDKVPHRYEEHRLTATIGQSFLSHVPMRLAVRQQAQQGHPSRMIPLELKGSKIGHHFKSAPSSSNIRKNVGGGDNKSERNTFRLRRPLSGPLIGQ